MGSKYALRANDRFYFATFTIIDWIDVFTRVEYRNIFLDSVRYCQKEKGLLVVAWCIMTNHVHMILTSNGVNDLEDIIKDMKSFTFRHIRKFIESRKEWMLELMKRAGTLKSNNKDFHFWQQHNHPIELSNKEIIEQKMDYMHTNPVKAGFEESPEYWILSSARDYAGLPGPLSIYFLR